MDISSNILQEFFLPEVCQNDWQRCPKPWFNTEGDETVVTVCTQDLQIVAVVDARELDGGDPNEYECLVRVTYANDAAGLPSSFICHLTWLLYFANEWNTCARPGIASSLSSAYRNAASLKQELAVTLNVNGLLLPTWFPQLLHL